MFVERSRIPLRTIVLFMGDIFCMFASLALATLIRLGEGAQIYLYDHRWPLLFSLGIYLLVYYIGGMYERQAMARQRGIFIPILINASIALLLIIIAFYAQFALLIGRGVLFIAFALVVASTWGVRHIYQESISSRWFTRNVLVVGTFKEARLIAALMKERSDPDFKLVGMVLDQVGSPDAEAHQGIEILGDISHLREYVAARDVETLVVATSLARELKLLQVLRPLRYQGIEILDYAAFYEHSAHEIPLDHIDDEWLMHAAMNASRIHIRNLKRIMDVTIAIVGLIVAAPVVALAALAIRVDSPGPILYRQRRAGQDGEVYTLFKLRSMRTDAESCSGAVWAGKNDPRVTRVGNVLRKSRIDEIPQLINVLRGEMSLVGPRPERPEFIDELAERIPFYRERLLVPPGITGWAQVNFPYTASIEASLRKVQFDLYYIKHMSLFLDIIIVLRTLKTILVGLRHSEDQEPSLVLDAKLAKKLAISLEEQHSP
jgi:sugar transferase (PEP-CTERM system associated)